MLNRVVLPAPLGPMRPHTMPGSMEKEILSWALTPPKVLVNPCNRKHGSRSGAVPPPLPPGLGRYLPFSSGIRFCVASVILFSLNVQPCPEFPGSVPWGKKIITPMRINPKTIISYSANPWSTSGSRVNREAPRRRPRHWPYRR